MGTLFLPRYKTSKGETKVSRVWRIRYRTNAGLVTESANTTNQADARRLLRQREGAVADGKPIVRHADKLLVRELTESLETEYKANGRKSAERLRYSLAHVLPHFGHRRAAQVSAADVIGYVAARQEQGASNATINRELAALKRAYTLAMESERLHRRPPIKMLAERNVRQGFFERDAFEAVRRRLPEPLRAMVTFAYATGWRIPSEVLGLEWSRIDFQTGTVRLEPGTTKNDEARVFFFTPELKACLEAQRTLTDEAQRKAGRIIPWVFHRGGRPIRDFRTAWANACRLAGVPGRIPHDFRRTAVRNLERAGVSRSVAMKMTGHKTEAVYRRYAIVSESDLRDAAKKLAGLVQEAVQVVEVAAGTEAVTRRIH
jgi:integrase